MPAQSHQTLPRPSFCHMFLAGWAHCQTKGVAMRGPEQLAHYSTEQTGLIYGFRFHPAAAGVEMPAAQLLEGLGEGEAGDGRFVWLHLNLAHSGSEKWLRTHLNLPEAFYQGLREGPASTRIEHLDGDALLAVINDVIFTFGCATVEVSSLWVYADPHTLITARLKPLRSVDTVRAAVKRGEVFTSPVDLLVHLLRGQADVLMQIVRETSQSVDGIEDRLLAQRLRHSRADLASMRRVLVRLQRLLAPEPAALFRLLNRPPAWLDHDAVQGLRQSTEEFAVVLSDLSALVERLKLLQEELAAQLNEQGNRTLFMLTLVTVLALPINMVAGLFGMNVGGIPLADNAHGFWILVLMVATFTVLAGAWAFRRREP